VIGWPVDGAALTTGSSDEVAPAVCSDSTGRLTLVWRTESPAGVGLRTTQLGPGYTPAPGAVPAAHVLAEGEAGVGDASVLSAEAGTTFVAWTSLPVGGSAAGAGLHLQRLAGDGAPDPAWPAGGARVCASALGRGAPRVVAQADSGVIVAWEDYRNGSSDIFAQRIDATPSPVFVLDQLNSGVVCAGGLTEITAETTPHSVLRRTHAVAQC
jgi:hypothetical protein